MSTAPTTERTSQYVPQTDAVKFEVHHEGVTATVELDSRNYSPPQWVVGLAHPIRRTAISNKFPVSDEMAARGWAEQVVLAAARAKRLYDAVEAECRRIVDDAVAGR